MTFSVIRVMNGRTNSISIDFDDNTRATYIGFPNKRETNIEGFMGFELYLGERLVFKYSSPKFSEGIAHKTFYVASEFVTTECAICHWILGVKYLDQEWIEKEEKMRLPSYEWPWIVVHFGDEDLEFTKKELFREKECG